MNRPPTKTSAEIFAVAGLFAPPALAHPDPGHDGHDFTWRFGSVFGLRPDSRDHLPAMIAIGLGARR